jgi:hypothetical protein
MKHRLPYIIALAEPRRLLGRWGPLVVGVCSDAPEDVREAWL